MDNGIRYRILEFQKPELGPGLNGIETLGFDTIKKWIKIRYNFRFCASEDDAKRLVQGGTAALKKVDSVAIIGGFAAIVKMAVPSGPKTEHDSFWERAAPEKMNAFVYCKQKAFSDALDENNKQKAMEEWNAIENYFLGMSDEQKKAIAASFTENLLEFISTALFCNKGKEVVLLFVKDKQMSREDIRGYGFGKTVCQSFDAMDFDEKIFKAPHPEQREDIAKRRQQILEVLRNRVEELFDLFAKAEK
jgi:hypothetical protein